MLVPAAMVVLNMITGDTVGTPIDTEQTDVTTEQTETEKYVGNHKLDLYSDISSRYEFMVRTGIVRDDIKVTRDSMNADEMFVIVQGLRGVDTKELQINKDSGDVGTKDYITEVLTTLGYSVDGNEVMDKALELGLVDNKDNRQLTHDKAIDIAYRAAFTKYKDANKTILEDVSEGNNGNIVNNLFAQEIGINDIKMVGPEDGNYIDGDTMIDTSSPIIDEMMSVIKGISSYYEVQYKGKTIKIEPISIEEVVYEIDKDLLKVRTKFEVDGVISEGTTVIFLRLKEDKYLSSFNTHIARSQLATAALNTKGLQVSSEQITKDTLLELKDDNKTFKYNVFHDDGVVQIRVEDIQ